MSVPASAASEAPTTVESSSALQGLTPDQRAKWYETGEFPEAQPANPQAVEGDEDQDGDADEIHAAGAIPGQQEPASAQQQQPAAKPISKRQQFVNDLIRERTEANLRAARAEQELAAARGGGQQSSAQPAAAPAEETAEQAADRLMKLPGAPKIEQFDTYERFMFAAQVFVNRALGAEAQAKGQQAQVGQQQAAQQQQVQARVAEWAIRRDTFAAQNPAFVEKTAPLLDALYPGTPLADVLIDSPIGPQMALYLSEHPEEIGRIVRLAPLTQLRELGKLESKIESSASAPASAGTAATKQVTTAPAPPVTLSGARSAPANDYEAAIGAGDFRAYEAAANRRDIGRR